MIRIAGNTSSKYPAFTLAEIIVAIGIFVVVVAVVLPIGLSQLDRETNKSQIQEVVSEMRLMQQNSYNGLYDSSHGVAFRSDGYYTFAGNSLATATQSEFKPYKRTVSLYSSNFALLNNEVTFLKGKLETANFGSVSLKEGNAIHEISVTQLGIIDYKTVK